MMLSFHRRNQMVGVGEHEVVDMGAEAQHLLPALARGGHFHGEERRVVDLDADLLHRRHQIVAAVRIVAQDRRKQLHHPLSPDRRAEIVPGAVAGDAQIDIAAELRVPQMHRRIALALDLRQDTRQIGGAFPVLVLLAHIPARFIHHT